MGRQEWDGAERKENAMTALMPRLFTDLFDWIETEPLVRPAQLIRIEDRQSDTEYMVRAELPGQTPKRTSRSASTTASSP